MGSHIAVNYAGALVQASPLTTIGILHSKRNDVLEIAQRPGVTSIKVFEPAAPGPGSDRSGCSVKSDKIYLQHILDMIRRIESVSASGHDAFVGSEVFQDAVLRNLHTMTETTQRLYSDLKLANSGVE